MGFKVNDRVKYKGCTEYNDYGTVKGFANTETAIKILVSWDRVQVERPPSENLCDEFAEHLELLNG